MEESFFDEEMVHDFIDESKEILETLNAGILKLEKAGGGSGEEIIEIFRSAHTLKGMSGMVGFKNMNKLTHTMENVLDLVRNGEMTLNAEHIDILLECLDKLNEMLDMIIDSQSDDVDVSDIVKKLIDLKEEKTETVSSDEQINDSEQAGTETVENTNDILNDLKTEVLRDDKDISIDFSDENDLKIEIIKPVLSALKTIDFKTNKIKIIGCKFKEKLINYIKLLNLDSYISVN